MDQFEIKEGTKKIDVFGDRNDAFIKAYLDLPTEFKQELSKVMRVLPSDGYSLSIKEIE